MRKRSRRSVIAVFTRLFRALFPSRGSGTRHLGELG